MRFLILVWCRGA